MKIGDRIYVRGYIDEIRKDTVIVRNDGGYFGTIPSEVITGELPSAQPEQRLSCKNCVHLGHGYMMPCKNCKRNQMLPDWYEVETERKKND